MGSEKPERVADAQMEVKEKSTSVNMIQIH